MLGLTPQALADAFERTWCEVDAGSFRLVTDSSRSDAEAMVRRLRTFRPVAEQYLPGTVNLNDPPLTVVVFERAGDFRRAIGSVEMAGYMQPSFTENLMVVGPDVGVASEQQSLLHEYVHYLLRTRTDINIPAWFDEGLASMLSTAGFSADEVEIGALPAVMLTSTIRDARLDLGEVLTAEDIWDWRRERRAGFYAWSWLLVHRLLLGQEAGRDDLRDGMTRFLAGEADSLTDALGESAWSLQRDLERYADRRARRVVHPAAGGGTAADEYRCLDQRDIVRQLSLAVVHHNPELVERHVRNQLDEHPEDAELWTILSLAHESADDRDATLEAARHAVSLAPQDISANVRLASALAMGCILDVSAECRARWQEAVPLLRRALRQDPMRHDAVFTLGLAYLYSGRAGDSLNYLRIAHKRQPWAPHVNFYLGEAYRLVGDVRAREHLTRARQWSPTLLWRKLAEAGLKQLDSDDR